MSLQEKYDTARIALSENKEKLSLVESAVKNCIEFFVATVKKVFTKHLEAFTALTYSLLKYHASKVLLLYNIFLFLHCTSDFRSQWSILYNGGLGESLCHGKH